MDGFHSLCLPPPWTPEWRVCRLSHLAADNTKLATSQPRVKRMKPESHSRASGAPWPIAGYLCGVSHGSCLVSVSRTKKQLLDRKQSIELNGRMETTRCKVLIKLCKKHCCDSQPRLHAEMTSPPDYKNKQGEGIRAHRLRQSDFIYLAVGGTYQKWSQWGDASSHSPKLHATMVPPILITASAGMLLTFTLNSFAPKCIWQLPLAASFLHEGLSPKSLLLQSYKLVIIPV